jgi:hypothetical protein
MRTFYKVFAGPLVLVAALSTSSITALAQGEPQHTVSPSDLAATVVGHVTQQDADRAAIREALGRPEVKNVASKVGIDLDRASAAASTLSGASLSQAAATARQVNDQLTGGASTIVISSETLIIILLLILLIILVR